jgi:hypothetical protein
LELEENLTFTLPKKKTTKQDEQPLPHTTLRTQQVLYLVISR